MDWNWPEAAAIAAAVLLVGLALFQLALAGGAPLGRAAWGGAHPGTLPTHLRIASGAAVPVWLFVALLVLSRAGLGPLTLPENLARWGVWVACGLLLLGTLANLASSSAWERFFWAPYALILAGLCFVVARSAM